MYLKDQGVCLKCCASTSHLARDCKVVLKCGECNSDKHITALHPGPPQLSTKASSPRTGDGGEPEKEDTTPEPVASPLCTEVCGDCARSKSCSKICLVKVYPKECPQQAIKMYAMLDDQSNKSLARSEFFNLFRIKVGSYPYTLQTCAGLAATSGRRANGYQIEAVNGEVSLALPTLIECDDLPDNRDEIPTPEAALHHPHLKSLASKIPPLDNDAKILLLLGRDILQVHKVRQQINGPGDAPFAQRLDLGAPRPPLPNNREQAMTRLFSLLRKLERKPRMKDQFIAFMHKIFDNNHAEPALPLPKGKECWYLPMFGVYHPRKPDQIRVVFDSSAQCNGISLNDVLLTGPDLNNSLMGVLIRFRRERVAIMADIEQMFHCFVVREDHRDYLRFLWYRDNDPKKDIVEYRMRVHCLRRAAKEGEQQYGSDTRHFVEREFYVDDGLVSTSTEEEAISLLQRTQASLSESNLRLHKITSKSVDVLKAFPAGDHAKGIKDLYLDGDAVPTQRSLGLSWDVKRDTFTFQVSVSDKPFTRRGILSTINSLFDPLGFVAPVTVQGNLLLRELTLDGTDWDSPLPQDKCKVWETWKNSLQELQHLHIPRAYTTTSCSNASRKEICIFSDASTKAIGAVAYLKTTDANDQIHSKRFYVYVHNRVQRIRQSTQPNQWRYVPTEHNPADHASRSVQASQLTRTNWFTGPTFLYKSQPTSKQHETFELINPDADVEIQPQVTTCVTSQKDKLLGCERFTKFSSWKSIRRGVATLIHVVCSFRASSRGTNGCNGWHWCRKPLTADELSKATTVILLAVQQACFPEDLDALSKGADVSKRSVLTKLNLIIDADGLLKVGGRLALADLSDKERHPVILPGKHHVSTLLIKHYHEQVEHQGRTITEGAIRAAGIWLVGGKRCVSTVLHGCVTCRKLRGKREKQKMSDLPQERLSTSPPFTYTGVDIFGPWAVIARRTRGGIAQSQRWAVLFTCMSTCAVHIEVIESLDTSSFINSLRRFFAIRGPSEHLYSDCGTNFVGACKELEFQKIVSKSEVQRYTNNRGCTWHFNPPHFSHMGGAWERMIGVARRILDSMLMHTPSSSLTHEVLCTLMAEVTAIINSRPLVSVSSDPDVPQILTPAMLLTQKQSDPPPPGTFTEKDLYKQQWCQVQRLANQFWNRWKREYLQTLQLRRKWQESSPNIERGDVVLMKDDCTCRNDWPMALVTNTFPGSDGKVRKIEIRVVKDGVAKVYLRPITEVVMVLKNQD
ncbi:collagen beta-1,O-galactosyltransferase [Sarotherodon galilaeus]